MSHRHRAGYSFPGSADLDTASCILHPYLAPSIGKSLFWLLWSGLGMGWEEGDWLWGFDRGTWGYFHFSEKIPSGASVRSCDFRDEVWGGACSTFRQRRKRLSSLLRAACLLPSAARVWVRGSLPQPWVSEQLAVRRRAKSASGPCQVETLGWGLLSIKENKQTKRANDERILGIMWEQVT